MLLKETKRNTTHHHEHENEHHEQNQTDKRSTLTESNKKLGNIKNNNTLPKRTYSESSKTWRIVRNTDRKTRKENQPPGKVNDTGYQHHTNNRFDILSDSDEYEEYDHSIEGITSSEDTDSFDCSKESKDEEMIMDYYEEESYSESSISSCNIIEKDEQRNNKDAEKENY